MNTPEYSKKISKYTFESKASNVWHHDLRGSEGSHPWLPVLNTWLSLHTSDQERLWVCNGADVTAPRLTAGYS